MGRSYREIVRRNEGWGEGAKDFREHMFVL